MTLPQGIAAGGPADFTSLLEQFDQAWLSGAPPRIERLVPPANAPIPRQQLLEELVKIELDHRWRLAVRVSTGATGAPAGALGPALPKGPRVEEYIARFPELGPVEQ